MLNRILKFIFKPVYYYLSSSRFRSLINLKVKYNGLEKYKVHQVKFANFILKVNDIQSFLDQYEAIFYLHCYRFTSESQQPIIYDCGANIGMATLYFKRLYPNAKVTSIEADQKIAAVLEENLKKNNLRNVNLIKKAVWINNLPVSFKADGGQGGKILPNSSSDNLTVPTIRLKDLIKHEESVDFLKLDIEGSELSVLKDCRKELHKVLHLFVEYHYLKGSDNSLSELLALLEDNGFYYLVQNNAIKKPFFYQSKKAVEYTVEIFAQRKRLT